jgi:hypothetical protein
VHEVLNSQPVKPHRVRYYLQRRDPAFEARKTEVLEVYAAAEMLRQMPEADRPPGTWHRPGPRGGRRAGMSRA